MMSETEAQETAFAALQELRAQPSPGAKALVPASRVLAYARRETDLVDLGIERVLRHSPGLGLLYRAGLTEHARAYSDCAAAAAGGRITQRQVGPYSLEVLEEEDDAIPWLVIRIPDGAPPVSMIELRTRDGDGRRVELGQPIDAVLQLPLDPGFPELAGLIDWLRAPDTEIYLF